ncbi:DUF934 domain-containing protein [Pararhizobium mangrovi]|uniref:DUF934 domain-containing protein n=1 Tax=Pararhizobium mangrovi TaxID=2590452 RepID=A0A506UGS0_9HYPH|nr:DUF934 domain-containing protein [Pararhizobium mangrovi]TPW31337.1 DUF934 domain-containing protein [Pararhizobium mangrovi]
MSRIWTVDGFVENDPWTIEPDAGASDGTRVPTLETFLAEFADGAKPAAGVMVEPNEEIERLVPYLSGLELVALRFPAFNDGRAFSQAALLRSRHGYAGALRATGDVLIDQIPLMLRCGFDSFVVTDEIALKRLADKRLTGIANHYQPAIAGDAPVARFSWRRGNAA